jgi:M6 family metalloprotease-like protein
LGALAKLRNLPNGETPAAIRSQASSVIGQRAAVLEALIDENPKEALSLAFSADLLTNLAAAFPDSAQDLESTGEWEGPLEVTIEDGVNLLSHKTVYHMKGGAGQSWNLHFEGEPDLQSGDVLRVRGVRVRSEVAALGNGTVTGTMVAGASMCSTLGAQRSIVLLVNMPGTTPPAITTEDVRSIFFGTSGRSVSGFWRENSYGQAWAEGDVRGWYTLDANYTCDQYPSIRDAAVRAADRDVDFSQYSRVFLIINGMGGDCGWAGLSNVGCGSTINTAEGSFTVSTAWMYAGYFSNPDYGVEISTHEGGHSLGLGHASTRDFGDEPLGALGAAGTLDEYGDRFSAMGFWNLGHYAAPAKAKLGWMTNYLTVSGNGSFVVQPTESLGSVQALKIQRGSDTSKFLWVEYRQNIGLYDSMVNPAVFSGALIHYQDSTTGSKTHLLDFTPITTAFTDPPLVGSWTDPYTSLSLRVSNATSSALNLDVNYGGSSPCITSTPTVGLSPLNPSVVEGGNVNYTVTITNNDTASCSPRNFSMTSLVPGAWPTTFAQNTVTVSPASQNWTSMTKTVPAGTVAATYSVDAVANSVSNSISATANVTVMPTPPPPPPTSTTPLLITVNAPPAPVRNTESISAVVTQGQAVAGATVVFTVVSPSGISTKKATTDSTGSASWSLKLNPKAPRGSYMVSAQASFGSQTATSTTATFTVQ